jgi:hypothetical protein
MSSHYLFHSESAATRKRVTERQQEAMARDPMMAPDALAARQTRIAQENELRRQQQADLESARKLKEEHERQLQQEQRELLAREAVRRRQEDRAREAAQRQRVTAPLDPRDSHATLARALGDKDGLRARDPNFTRDPMTSRHPSRPLISAPPPTE